MGILDSIFGKKHSESEQTKAQTIEAESQAIPTVMNYERSSLLKYVDKKMPVLIIGGKYNQKQVVLTSNPKYKSCTHNGHSWPCATIGMVTGEEPEPIRYNGTKPAKQEQSTEANPEDEKVNTEVKDISEAFNFNEIKDECRTFLIPIFHHSHSERGMMNSVLRFLRSTSIWRTSHNCQRMLRLKLSGTEMLFPMVW